MTFRSGDIDLEPSRYECCAMPRNLKRYANVYALMMKTSMWPAVQQASLLSSCSPSPIHWMEKMRTFCEARSRKSKINNFSSLLWLLLFCCWCQISGARGIFILSITKNFIFFFKHNNFIPFDSIPVPVFRLFATACRHTSSFSGERWISKGIRGLKFRRRKINE